MTPPSEAELRRRIESGLGDVEDYLHLVEGLMWAARLDEAVAVCRQALDRLLEPVARAEILIELASCLDALGQTAEAARTSREALALVAAEPLTSRALMARAMSQADLARYDCATDEAVARDMMERALADFERLFAEDPPAADVAIAYREAADLANWIGDGEKAIAYGRAGQERSTDRRERTLCLAAVGEGLRLLGRYAEAERAVDEALAIADEHPLTTTRLLITRGLAVRGTGRTDEAVQTLEHAISTTKRLPDATASACREAVHGHLADIYYEQHRYREAAASYQTVLMSCPATSPVRVHLRLMLGHCSLAMGADDLAGEHYEAVLADGSASEGYRRAAQEGLVALGAPVPPLRTRVWYRLLRWLYGP